MKLASRSFEWGYSKATCANEMRRDPQGDSRQLSWPPGNRQECRGNNYLPSQDVQSNCETSMVAACARVEDKQNSGWDESTVSGENVRGEDRLHDRGWESSESKGKKRPRSKTETFNEQSPEAVGETGSGSENVSCEKGEGVSKGADKRRGRIDERPAIEQSWTEDKAWVQALNSRRFSVNRGKRSAYNNGKTKRREGGGVQRSGGER